MEKKPSEQLHGHRNMFKAYHKDTRTFFLLLTRTCICLFSS